MSRTVCKTVFKFDELSDRAKQKALEWYSQFVFSDSNDWRHTYDDAVRIGDMIGIVIDMRNDGSPDIMFSGFASQGDGACFGGSYSHKSGGVALLKKEAPTNKKLLAIAEGLQAIQKKHRYRVTATTCHRGHYMHSGCMSVELGGYGDEFSDETEKSVTQLLRDFADWIYTQLREENDYQSSGAVMSESILANGYEFDEDGSQA